MQCVDLNYFGQERCFEKNIEILTLIVYFKNEKLLLFHLKCDTSIMVIFEKYTRDVII